MQPARHNLIQILEYASTVHSDTEVVWRRPVDGTIQRYSYADAWIRVQQFATALQGLGIEQGDRVATLAWNTQRHFEAWYAIAGQGAICHTINPRLFEPQLQYIFQHAKAKALLVDETLWPVYDRIKSALPDSLQCIILLGDSGNIPADAKPVMDYEQILAGQPQQKRFEWPKLEDDTPATLCYTSGTTGNPKGVLYTHGANLRHATALNTASALHIGCQDTVLMIASMYHANGWGLAYACPMAGAKLVLPGNQLDGPSLFELLANERVTFAAAVPTLGQVLLTHLQDKDLDLPDLRDLNLGGAAVPPSLIRAFDERQITVVQGWGMTEMSPIGTVCRLKAQLRRLPYEQQVQLRAKQGLPVFGIELKLVDEQGVPVSHDGITMGRLLVRGPWVCRRYYLASQDCVDEEGWFDTGDIATIDPDGYLKIVDRAKDLIKSGGEWIASIELESAAMIHPHVRSAAIIGMPHAKWQERPLLILELVTDQEALAKSEILDLLRERFPKWWLPDAIETVDTMPQTATGKVDKIALRKLFST